MKYNGYFDPGKPYSVRRGNLPHLRQEGGLYFVTFRLGDSIPRKKLREWERRRQMVLDQRANARSGADVLLLDAELDRLTGLIDRWLDCGWGSCLLRFPAAKSVVDSTLQHFDGLRYELNESVVAANHVHAIVRPADDCELSEIVRSWKAYSTKALKKVPEVRRMIGSGSGVLWQRESFDHLVRNEKRHDEYIQYIRAHR